MQKSHQIFLIWKCKQTSMSPWMWKEKERVRRVSDRERNSFSFLSHLMGWSQCVCVDGFPSWGGMGVRFTPKVFHCHPYFDKKQINRFEIQRLQRNFNQFIICNGRQSVRNISSSSSSSHDSSLTPVLHCLFLSPKPIANNKCVIPNLHHEHQQKATGHDGTW